MVEVFREDIKKHKLIQEVLAFADAITKTQYLNGLIGERL